MANLHSDNSSPAAHRNQWRYWFRWSGVAILVTTAAAPGFAQVITEYPITTGGNTPISITSGPDGNLWFTMAGSGGGGARIGKSTTSGVMVDFLIPTANSNPDSITAGPDGALWFAENQSNKIGRITTTGTFTEFAIPTASSGPQGIAAGPDGALWFTERTAAKIGRITTAGVITEFGGLTGGSGPIRITSGPDGNLWFTEINGNKIGRITTAGVVTEFPIPTAASGPFGITSGPGGLWFGERSANKIALITTAGVVTEVCTLASLSFSADIVTGPDGNLWFSENGNGGNIGRCTPAGVLSTFPLPVPGQAEGMTVGPDNNLWFTDLTTNNRIGKTTLAISLVYKPLEPCRIMDTRNATLGSGVQGPILGNVLYQIPGFITAGSTWGQYGGAAAADCGLTNPPAGAIHAVALVITILAPNFDAFLGVGDVNNLNTTLSTVALNYTHGQGLSTMYLVPQDLSNTIYFALPAGLSANLIFDVVGYAVLSDATALQCTTQTSAVSTIAGSGGTGTATSPVCGAGYALTSGSCDSDSLSMNLVQHEASGQAWLCSAVNFGGSAAHLTATANCCRVGGM